MLVSIVCSDRFFVILETFFLESEDRKEIGLWGELDDKRETMFLYEMRPALK